MCLSYYLVMYREEARFHILLYCLCTCRGSWKQALIVVFPGSLEFLEMWKSWNQINSHITFFFQIHEPYQKACMFSFDSHFNNKIGLVTSIKTLPYHASYFLVSSWVLEGLCGWLSRKAYSLSRFWGFSLTKICFTTYCSLFDPYYTHTHMKFA